MGKGDGEAKHIRAATGIGRGRRARRWDEAERRSGASLNGERRGGRAATIAVLFEPLTIYPRSFKWITTEAHNLHEETAYFSSLAQIINLIIPSLQPNYEWIMPSLNPKKKDDHVLSRFDSNQTHAESSGILAWWAIQRERSFASVCTLQFLHPALVWRRGAQQRAARPRPDPLPHRKRATCFARPRGRSHAATVIASY